MIIIIMSNTASAHSANHYNDITDTDDENDEQQLETDEFLDFWGDDNDETTDFTLILSCLYSLMIKTNIV